MRESNSGPARRLNEQTNGKPPTRSWQPEELLDALADLVAERIAVPTARVFQLLRPAEAAKVVGLSRSALYVKIQAGEIPAIRDGRAVMVDVRDLEAWAQARKRLG
jgi:excisionase family DNA binding protein